MKSLVIATVVALVLSGCLSGGGTADTQPGKRQITDMSIPLADYLHDLSPVLEGVSVETGITEHYRIASTDGVIMDTWILRPDIKEPAPIVLEITPYYGGGDPLSPTNPLAGYGQWGAQLVSRGYAVGISSVRGTGLSEGCFSQGGPQEAVDSAAVIEYVAAQDWSNGNVGVMGVSYPGTTPQDVWVEAPPSLKTVVPIEGISDLYKYNFVNGVPIDVQGLGFNTYYWAMVGASPAGLSGGAFALDPTNAPAAIVGEACTDQIAVQESGVSSSLDGDKDAYWQTRDFMLEYLENPTKERASVFYIQGFQDWNVKPHMLEEWLPTLQSSGVPFKAWLGQWAHAWPQQDPAACASGSPCRIDWWTQTMVAWFDYYLKGIDTGIMDAPAVQVQDDTGMWRHESFWPSPTKQLNFNLAQGKLVTTEGTGSYSFFDSFGGQPGHSATDVPIGMVTPTQVMFRSEPIDSDLRISGMPVYHGNVMANSARTSIVFTLAEELPNGNLRAFNYAAQSLNHVKSLESGDDDISGETLALHLRFFPQEDVVKAGSRLVLIAAGNTVSGGQPGPSLIPVTTGATITLDGATGSLRIPVDESVVFEDPQPIA